MPNQNTPLMEQPTKLNREKEDLKEPLPEWTKDDLKDVALYGSKISPPCCKIRTILNHYGVKFSQIEGPKKDSEYKKVPVLMLNGRQVNDSFIMVKELAKILDGKALTPELIEVEETFTFGAMISLEADVADSCSDLCGCAGLLGGCLGCLLGTLSCCIACGVNIRKGKPELKDTTTYGAMLSEKLRGKKFFHGDEPGIVDVSLFGAMLPFAEAKTQALEGFLDAGMREWHEAISEIVQQKV
uniref:GST N-terminal domain-containing protein n=1 Tax=Lotharella globosa TaxID=91324 RepID=A0A7S3Z901_9EUKA